MGHIFAVEGAWEDGVEYLESVRPVLETIASTTGVGFVHRHAETPAMMRALMDIWVSYETGYHVGYFAFHGVPGAIEFQHGEQMSLEELGEHLDRRVNGGVIHLGGCSVLRIGDRRLQEFRKRAGASLVTGFRRDVDWLESAAFEVLALYRLADSSPGHAINHITRKYPDLVDRLGFVAVS